MKLVRRWRAWRQKKRLTFQLIEFDEHRAALIVTDPKTGIWMDVRLTDESV